MSLHPAKALYRDLFAAEAAHCEDQITLPTAWVERSTFMAACQRAGIDCPTNPIAFIAWEESIGLPAYVRRVIAAHHRLRGTKPAPSERAYRTRANH